MSLYKKGAQIKITKKAYTATEALIDTPQETKITEILHKVDPEFLFYTAKAISSLEPHLNFNGNGDGFPKAELKKAYKTFEGRGIFLNHESDSPLKSVGTILSAEYLEDPETGAAEIQILGRIDRKLFPEISRMIETNQLSATSMGCSCDESICSICGTTLHSDADEKCEHLSALGLNKEYEAQVDFPEYGIFKGQKIKAGAINKGISFNEDSLVNVPADPTAKISQVLARNIRERISKKASLTKEETLDLMAQFEKVLSSMDVETANQIKAEFCGCPTIVKEESSKESSMSDKNVVSEGQKKILSKISALEMEQLESYIQHKTKKANEKEVIAEATKKEETFLSKIVAKVKDSFAAQLLEKKVEAVAKEELKKEEKHGKDCECTHCGLNIKTKSSLSAKFNEDKNNVLASTWAIYEGDKLVLDASLKDIWGSQFELLSFEDQKYAISEEYGKEVIARYQKEGIAKLAYYWDVENKLNKTASEPKLGPSGTHATPTTGTDNKEHNVKNSPISKPESEKLTPGKGSSNKEHEVKTETKLDMPGQDAGQKGPAAPKGKEVKTDYNEPKPEAGKEVSTTPKNPEEKDLKKSEKEMKTDYTPEGKEHQEAEEKETSSKKSYKEQNSLIKWSAMSSDAQEFIKKHVEKHIKEDGMERAQAVAAAYSEAREKGFDVPAKKSSQETIMEKKAADKPTEAVEGSTLPEGKKSYDGKPDEASKESTEPKSSATSGSKPEEASASTLPEGKKTYEGTPDEASKESTQPKDKKTSGDKPEEASKESTQPESKATAGGTPDEAVKGSTQAKAALETKADNKDLTAPPVVDKVMSDKPDMAVQKEEAMGAYASALDKAEKLDIGEGYSASKDKETKEIIISKDGKEVKRLPDGFANEVPEVLKLLRAVLGLPPVEEKKEVAPMAPAPEAPKMEEEAPKPEEEHPALEEAHEDEMGMKESALKTREEAVSKKEAELKAIEVKAQEEEKAKKFAAILSVRSERCQKIVANMVDKEALKMDDAVYQSELKSGTYLLDAQHKAFQASIKAKHKELLAMDDMSLKAFEKVVEELPTPSHVNTKKATRVPYLTYDPSDTDEVGNIFRNMGTLKGKSINDIPKK